MSESFSPDGGQWAPRGAAPATPSAGAPQFEAEYPWAQPNAAVPDHGQAPVAPVAPAAQAPAPQRTGAWSAAGLLGEPAPASVQSPMTPGHAQPVAAQHMPTQTMPAQQQMPAQHMPTQAMPPQRMPQQSAPQQAAPQQAVRQQSVQQQGASQQGMPQQRQQAPTAPSPPGARSRGARVGMSQALEDGDLSLDTVLRMVVEQKASDLHLTARSVPMLRIDGTLVPLDGFPELEGESLKRTLYQILTQKHRERFEENLELDFAYQVPGGSRFRVNIYQQRDTVGAAFRVIPHEIRPLEHLGVPGVVGSFANLPRGLVLVTGPTGSGKSTTLASVVDLANRTRAQHIMTVEDPIEFLHEHKKSLVNQREVGVDTKSFANALKHVLRQDPDVILVGEMRDLETISVALTAAETGHLVFATLHTQDAAQTIDRIIDVFPPSQQDQVRVQLASAIEGVVCQTLCKKATGVGRVVATEVMIATPGIRNLIREGKTHQIYSAMQAGKQLGMHSMDQHLADLVRQGQITYEMGLEKCHHIEDFNRLTGRAGGSTGSGIAKASMGAELGAQGMGVL